MKKKITLEEWKIMREQQHRFLNVTDRFMYEGRELIQSSTLDWPTWLRRLYLVFFPIAFPVRWLTWLVWSLMMLLSFVGCVFINWVYCSWIGIPTYWQKMPNIEGYDSSEYE